MLEFKKVDISDKEIIQKYFNTNYLESSELSFLSMLIWSKGLNIKYAISNDCMVFTLQDGTNLPSIRFPIGNGDLEKTFYEECEYFKSIGQIPRFYGLLPFQMELMKGYNNNFVYEPMTDYFDYVYNVSDLINLPGKKYHGKKNHINNFIKNNNYEYSQITMDDAKDIMETYDMWLQIRDDSDDSHLISERNATSLLLNNVDILELVGGVLRIDGKVCAFTIGEQLNSDTVVIHTEKAFNDVRGSYPFINQQYLEHHWSHMTYVNREEDIGIEGLRIAKQSYHPVKMIEKYKAVEKN